MSVTAARLQVPPLGVIEGFYGPAWNWEERAALATQLAPCGYGFWHYAPKSDPGIRSAWRSPWPSAHAEALRAFAEHCREHGMGFGIGLTPAGLRPDGPPADWDALARRLAELDAIGIDDLLIGFDDLHGDRRDLAWEQVGIVDWVATRTRAARIVVCPTYYSDDPLLDRLFGARPHGYLETLGRSLDPHIGIYWAGEEICPREIRAGHLDTVAGQLRREPWLWDNYPVNDGPVACEHLHLRPFTGRPASLGGRLSAHAINPALQPTLTGIPALTLPVRYRLGECFAYRQALSEAAAAVLGDELAACVLADLPLLEDAGRQGLGEQAAALRARYAAFDHPAAREILRWLDGGYQPQTAAPGLCG